MSPTDVPPPPYSHPPDCTDCTHCLSVCTQGGQARCEPRGCAPTPCSHPATLLTVLTRCLSVCTQGGQARCEPRGCAPTPCSHPATLPGECCPRCNFCLYERRIFRHVQRFLHPDDPCQECACQVGGYTGTSVYFTSVCTTPKGGRGISDVFPPPCLESQGCQFDPTFLYLLSCFST